MIGGVRSGIRMMAALTGGLVLAAPAAATTTYDAPAKQVTVRGDAGIGPVALREASVFQRGEQLVIRVRTAGALSAGELRSGVGPGHRICVGLRLSGDVRLCLDGRRDRLRVARAAIDKSGRASRWTLVPATVGRPSKRVVQIRAPLAGLGVAPGRIRWAVDTSWRDDAECAAKGACASRLPASGTATYPVRQRVSVGCLATGPTVVTRGRTTGRRIALTFDDGPGPYTAGYLDVLRRHRVPATFFVVGQKVAARQALLQRMVREGHAVANHSWNHSNLAAGGRDQLSRTNEAIRAATGTTSCLFRPPYGARSATLDAQVRSLGMLDVLWTVDTNDWRRPGSAVIADRVLRGARPGAIVLMHDAGGAREQGVAALPRIITTLKARGYQLVTVPELLGLSERIRYR